MKKSISKISKLTLSDQLYEELQTQILSGELKKGEKLPGETALSEMYGVSRLTTRAALQKLAAIGLIEVRTGEGSFVNGVNFDNIMSQISHLISKVEMDQYLPEFRTNIETQCALLAVERATEEELDHFDKLLDRMEEACSSGDVESYIENDYKFHHYLCHMSSNPLYEMVYSAIKELFISSIQENVTYMINEDPDGIAKSLKKHREFAATLRSGNKEETLKAISYMINYAKNGNADK